MADQGELYEKSWILHHILDGFIGSREIVAVRRRWIVEKEIIANLENYLIEIFNTGSSAEGISMKDSDMDRMLASRVVLVACPDQYTSIPADSTGKTVLMMRDTDSRPGYVALELVDLGQNWSSSILMQLMVPVGDVHFISSEMHRRLYSDIFRNVDPLNIETHGPATTLKKGGQCNYPVDCDHVFCFPCYDWPKVASEWVSRPRLHEWPDKALRDQIVQGGCHLVPVGDKTSADTFLQWRISFATAEGKLIRSLTHIQFLVYGLLKYFLKQISGMLQHILGDVDILSSYIIKTVILHAVEGTPALLWQEKNTFICFMLCFRILITWVKAGYCPNYFINSNNMFLGKVHGDNQQKLLRLLIDLHEMKWECLSVGTFIQPSIGERIKSVQNGEWEELLPSSPQWERDRDMLLFSKVSTLFFKYNVHHLALLYKSKSDLDELFGYVATVRALADTGIKTFSEHNAARGNKEKYKALRKCKNLLTPRASVCTSPGLLTLATYYYQIGNYGKTLEMCGHMISSFKIYFDSGATFKDKDRYEHLYCGRGYTLLHKYQEAYVSAISPRSNALQFWPSQLHMELNVNINRLLLNRVFYVNIPPLPYAVFLSFLCYHELGDTRRRDSALIHLRAVKYDVEQGGDNYWIVHTLMGICYEMVGDKQRALREYRDSIGVHTFTQMFNPAKERIDRLQHSK